jgi:hypothetical protein
VLRITKAAGFRAELTRQATDPWPRASPCGRRRSTCPLTAAAVGAHPERRRLRRRTAAQAEVGDLGLEGDPASTLSSARTVTRSAAPTDRRTSKAPSASSRENDATLIGRETTRPDPVVNVVDVPHAVAPRQTATRIGPSAGVGFMLTLPFAWSRLTLLRRTRRPFRCWHRAAVGDLQVSACTTVTRFVGTGTATPGRPAATQGDDSAHMLIVRACRTCGCSAGVFRLCAGHRC